MLLNHLPRSIRAFFSICLTSLLLAVSAHAAGFVVTKTADTNDGSCNADCSLREAIAAANAASSNDFISFDLSVFNVAQTIVLAAGELAVANNGTIEINGPGSNLLTISGNNASRVLKVNAGVTMTLLGVKIASGKLLNSDAGAGINNAGNLSVVSCIVSENSAAGNGGGILNDGAASTLLLVTSTVSDNVGNGAGVYNSSGTATLNNSMVTGNLGGNGAGVLNVNGTLNLNGTTISGNSAGTTGGGIGGGIANFTGNVTANLSTISSNTALSSTGGAGIYNDGGSITLLDTSIGFNFSHGEGGGIHNVGGGGVSMTNGSVNNNFACSGCRGGGVSVWGNTSTATLTNVSVNNNSAHAGGGIFIENGATLNVTGAAIRNNNANVGGGLAVSGGTANLTNTTVGSNSAGASSGGAGGILVGSAILNLTNVTVAGNTTASTQGGGGIVNGSGTAVGTINSRNSIIADNIATASNRPDLVGTLTSDGYNLIENTTGSTINGVTTGNILGVDPLLVPLRDNGGPTHTFALMPTSPAIDTADPANFPSTDQRGITRPQDGDINGSSLPDIGAYERKVTLSTVTKTADTNDGVCDTDCSLREAMGAINTGADRDVVVVFDSSVFSSQQVITLTMGQLTIPTFGTVWIRGAGANLVAVSGNDLTRVIFIDTGGVGVIQNISIRNGNDTAAAGSNGGGGIRNQGILLLTNAILSNNRAANYGGGLNSIFNSRTVIANTIISGNTANRGAGFYNNNGTLTLTDVTIAQNTALLTGGGFVSSGGINGSPFIANRILVINNTAAAGGGMVNDSDAATITNAIVMNNQATANNLAISGGGIANEGRLTLSNSTVSNNTAASGGGGIHNFGTDSTTLNISNSTISGNTAVKYGGGIDNNAVLTITNSTISNNSVTSTGGSTEGWGGGIMSSWAMSLSHVTIANNSAGFSGGGVRNAGSLAFSSRNSIIANNQANNSAPDFQGTLTSQGYNLIENTSGTTIAGVTTGNILGQDPQLGNLASNGGPTLTRALLPGSPAIDAGDPSNVLATDQRGVTRPKDGDRNGVATSDIGAFERDGSVDNPPFDFDGDGKTDLGIFRPGVAEWWINRSSDGSTFAAQFGATTDKLAPGDYTGDGKADIAIWRPSSGEWFILRSEDSSFFSFPFGTNGDTPVPTDYDSDGKVDAAVFRASNATWYIRRSSDGGTTIESFGTNGDFPVAADYDGDGKSDIAIYRPSLGQWWIKRSTAGVIAFTFGTSTDKPVQGDYTGDGKSDVAFWRPSTGEWYVLRSGDFSYYSQPFGTSTDIPSPGDYDGDGKFDPTVFRPSSATWFSNRSTAGTLIQQFGSTGDQPVPNAFVP